MRKFALLFPILLLSACGQSSSGVEKEPPSTQQPAQTSAATGTASAATGDPTPPKPAAQSASPGPKLPQGAIKKTVRFKKGDSAATMNDAVVRGETHFYEIGAKEGQKLDVKITSGESNAIFRLYVMTADKWPNRRNENGLVAFADIEDPNSKLVGLDNERTSYSGKLPAGAEKGFSRYGIEVGATRGNATYTLTVAIDADTSAPACKGTEFCTASDGRLGLCSNGTCRTCRAGFNLLHESTRCHPVLDCASHRDPNGQTAKSPKCDQCMSGACFSAPESYEPNW